VRPIFSFSPPGLPWASRNLFIFTGVIYFWQYGFYILVLLLYRSRILSAALSLLLAFSPTFIAANRVGLYTGTLLMFFGVSSVLCFLLWVRKKRFSWLAGACLLLGLGIGSRCFFWWFFAALLIFSIIFCRKQLQELCNLCLRKKLISFFMLSIGSLPLVLFNMLNGCQTMRFFVKHTIVSSDGVSNLNYLQNLKERVSELLNILKGTAYSGSNENMVNVYMLVVSVIILMLSIVYAQVFKKQRICGSYLFPSVIFLLVLIQSPLTISGLSALHIYYMMPFALMIIASAVMFSKNRIIFSCLIYNIRSFIFME
jgi:4-amino-4-deoxy-L-arabinose transferase-like glycosyltransferase